MNIQKMMKQAQQMQKKMEEAQDKLGDLEVMGSAGAGMVEVTLTGKGEARKVKIDPKIVDPDDIEMMEDLIVAAINDAKSKSETASNDEMSKITGGMGLPPGMKMPF